MPSAMIHLLTAHTLWPDAPDPFWLGSLAPDAMRERAEKDAMHLRGAADRPLALKALRDRLDVGDPFARACLLHLFADLRWDAGMIDPFRQSWAGPGDWYPAYRAEAHRASYGLFHGESWSGQVWAAIQRWDGQSLPPAAHVLSISAEVLADYRETVLRKHRQSPPDSASPRFPRPLLLRFAQDTAEAFADWVG